MRPNDRPAIITVAVPLQSTQPPAVDQALREAEAIATQAGGIPHSRRVHYSHTVLDVAEDDDVDRIAGRSELQAATSWLVLTAEVHST